MISIFSNTLGEQELEAVRGVLESRWLGRGPQCAAFEREFADHIGASRVLLFNNCTSATLALLRAVGVWENSEVIVPSIQFVGVANSVIQAGCIPVFADVDPVTLNIEPSEIERLKTPKTRGVFMLHYGGHPAPMREIRDAATGALWVLEDAANAVASTYYGLACGTLADGGVWSFDAMKLLCMGDGGALWARNDYAYEWAECYRYLGFAPKTTSGTDSMAKGRDRWWAFELQDVSGRHISNDVLASMGRIQLLRLGFFLDRRRRIWDTYQDELSGVGDLELPPEPMDGCRSSYYLYWVQTDKRDALARYMADNGIYTTFRYYPLHRVERYRAYTGTRLPLPNAERVADRTLCIPLHQNLSDSDVQKIVDVVKKFYERV